MSDVVFVFYFSAIRTVGTCSNLIELTLPLTMDSDVCPMGYLISVLFFLELSGMIDDDD